MSRPKYKRPRHVLVQSVLDRLNRDFLKASHCYFGGGTRIVLELGEYRDSADVDLLCSNRDGYRELRSTVSSTSLGSIGAGSLFLAREITADIYGIRTFLEVDGQKVKFEIVNEARIDLTGAEVPGIPIACLERHICFAEKLLANCDRWADRAFLSRDLIDLAFMMEAWSPDTSRAGLEVARAAYGKSIDRDLDLAVRKMLDDKDYYKRCLSELAVTDERNLASGLKKLAAWDAVARLDAAERSPIAVRAKNI